MRARLVLFCRKCQTTRPRKHDRTRQHPCPYLCGPMVPGRMYGGVVVTTKGTR